MQSQATIEGSRDAPAISGCFLQLRPVKAQFDTTSKCHSLCQRVEISFQDGLVGGAILRAAHGKTINPNGGWTANSSEFLLTGHSFEHV
jgi:hypothetical protein